MTRIPGKFAARIAGAALLALALIAPGSASAQRVSDEWKFNAVIYGWFPSIGGKTNFPAANGGTDVNVDIDKILDNLKFVFMGSFEARKGRWGMLTDIVYMDVGGSKQKTRDFNYGGNPLPIGVQGDASLDIKGAIGTIAGTYRAFEQPDAVVDFLAGARVLSVKTTLDTELNGDFGNGQIVLRKNNNSERVSNWDGIIGAKGRSAFGSNREWFIPWYLDAGAGDSHFTWQAYAGLGYSFTWGEVVGVWRYIDYNMKSGEKVQDLNFNGPAIGVAFRW